MPNALIKYRFEDGYIDLVMGWCPTAVPSIRFVFYSWFFLIVSLEWIKAWELILIDYSDVQIIIHKNKNNE